MAAQKGVETIVIAESHEEVEKLFNDLQQEESDQAASTVGWWIQVTYPGEPAAESNRVAKHHLMKSTYEDGRWRYILDIRFNDSDEMITIKSIKGS